MSLGIVGAIDPGGRGDLCVHYAVASTYSAHIGWLNKSAAACKRCGESLAKGEGTRVVIAGMEGPCASVAYFCKTCVEWVQASIQMVMDRRAEDAKGNTPQLGQAKRPDTEELKRLAKQRGIKLED